jgi:protein TonB
MKTFSKAYNSAVNAENLEDIVFEGRNQAYGAYSLRRNYNVRINLSTLAVLSFAGLIAIVAFIKSVNKPIAVNTPPTEPPPYEVKLEDINDLLPPPTFEVNVAQSVIDNSRFAPVIVDEANMKEPQLATNEDLLNAIHSTDLHIDLSAVTLISPVDKTDDAIDNQNNTFFPTDVTEQAMFRGGTVDDFRKWLGEHIIYPDMAASSAISGTVFLRFTIDKEGKLCDIRVDRGIHPLIDQAAVEALQSSPKWRAARINGHPVRVCYTIPIKFSLQNF